MHDMKTRIEHACLEVLDRFMAALNAHDAAAMDATMHFPHVRSAGGEIKVYPAPGANPMDIFKRFEQQDGWSHSEWRRRELVQFSADKAHVALDYTRFRRDGSVIGVYESLYVLTRVGDAWGIQMRSSFAP